MSKINYESFLQTKKRITPFSGIDIDRSVLPESLFEYEKDCIIFGLKLGKAAFFEDCGLGKTIQQIVWGDIVCKHTGGNVLILAPLAVTSQTKAEGKKFNISVHIASSQNDIQSGINITNYQKLDKFDPLKFEGIVLDESSILKSFMGTIKNQIIDSFKKTPFKLACTATPAPNDYMELGNHAEFLDIMPSNEMLARWFINDTMHFGTYRVKGHAMKSFWEWISSWAVCIRKPSDFGYSDEGFILPSLNFKQIIVPVDATQNTDGTLFRQAIMSATSLHREMRLTAPVRAKMAAEIVNSSDETWIIWCNTDYEADELKKCIPDAIEVRGSEKAEVKEQKLIAFSLGLIKKIITKPSIAGFGMNWQHCHNQIVAGLSYSWEKLYQAIRRSYRFGQTEPVNVYLIVAETEGNVLLTVKEKMRAHQDMQEHMYQTNFKKKKINRKELKIIVDEKITKGQNWIAVNSDCVEYSKKIKNNSIHFTIFSPPFSGLYIYSDSIRDMGNSLDDKEFFEHFKYIIPELYRITKPGRLCAVHCKNLVNYKGRDGKAGLRDFRGDIIRVFQEHEWTYHSEICIWKDPVIEMQRTKAHGLLYKQLRADSTFSRQGLAEYLLLFRKWAKDGDEIEAVGSKENSRFDHYIGEISEPVSDSRNKHRFAIQIWQRYASPVWMDIRQTNVLNSQAARDPADEKHICPLQLDVIERAIELWTNSGDLVFDPFGGIGSTGVVAVKMGRKTLLVELKESYYRQSVRNLRTAEISTRQINLFDEPEIVNAKEK